MNTWNEEFDKYVGSYSKYQNKSDYDLKPENFIKTIGSDMGRAVGFKRVAVHHIILPPNCRTSSPHAESHEEEFVFVIKGNPHLWLNGYIHDLKQGYAVGFPSGTGVAHTFINNTNSDVHLLVAGEQSKIENLCSFPINPELKETCKIWWENPPEQKFGPHDGLPHGIKDVERAMDLPSNIVDCNNEPRREPFFYPGDNEKFGHGFRITDRVGLKSLGIWFECLPAGRRTAFPHAHTHEEEFIYVLKGSPTVWVDGYTKTMEADHFAGFPSNTGYAHTLINNTNEDVFYICIGETQDFSDEKISYPLHPLRQSECLRKNWYWTDLPKKQLGPHNGFPDKPFKEHIKFKIVGEQNLNELFAAEQKINIDLPTKKHEKFYSEYLIVEMDQQVMGALGLYLNHPEENQGHIALFFLTDNLTEKDIGQKVRKLAEDYIKRAHGCNLVSL